MHRGFLKTGAWLGAITIILGAFGAHTLKKWVDVDALNAYETGIYYQMFQVLAIFLIGVLYKSFPGKWMRFSGRFFAVGILFFSGSLYAITFLRAMHNNSAFNIIGPITPIGGLFFILGWVCMAVAIHRKN
ncbi:DUF423 domain-containing protein [Hydrotalea sp.]|uniref:DUF423 domain-containing protein n=1 Tax=Hydrotalea sp. TaxID=2881279 RepID=UPI002635491D|nr:DUF423 domain-containing protein [Hydrotalea sp.]